MKTHHTIYIKLPNKAHTKFTSNSNKMHTIVTTLIKCCDYSEEIAASKNMPKT